jgi:soluble lytic murein transglycosylase-like protein
MLLALPLALAVNLAAPDALSAQSTAPEVKQDTAARPGPRLFERRVLFSPEYLSRLIATARSQPTESLVEAIPPADHEARAATYAARYKIDPTLALQIVESAVAEGIDPELAFRLVRVESVFRPAARSPGGALGLTQLMPGTARAIDRTLRTESQILEPSTNLRTGFRYLRRMIERYDGDVRLGLLAYNRGERAVDNALRAGRDPENGYSRKVLGTAENRYDGRGLLTPPR